MADMLDSLQTIDYSNFPVVKIALVVGLFILALVLRQLVYSLVVRRIEGLAAQTETDLDDELLKVLRPTVNVLIFIATIWVIPLIFAGDFSAQASASVNGLLKILTLFGAVFITYRISSVLGFFASTIVIRAIERMTGNEEEALDQDLVAILRPSLRLLIFLIGLWVVQLIFAGELSAELNKTVNDGLRVLTIVIIATVIYRSAAVLGQLTSNLLLATTEEAGLSELFRPFMPKLFQAIAIMVIVIKGAELFFGGSAGPLVGLLGGAGLTLGLLFKDLIYDWFCTVVIYTDKLFDKGDWIVVDGLDAMVQVVEIGFRSTSLLSSTRASIQKIPNSKMITGIVQNWSQDAGDEEVWGIPLTLKIDGISSQQAARVYDGLKEIHQSLEGLKDKHLVRFKGLEENARVFEFRLYTTLSSFFRLEKEAHIAILAMLEREGINALHVRLETDPVSYDRQMQAVNN